MPNIFQRLIGNRPIMPKLTRSGAFTEHGVSGTPIFGGFVQLNEKSSKWSGQNKYRTASEIAVNVSIVAAGIHHVLNMLARPSWTVVPADRESSEAQELAEFVYDVMHSMHSPWASVIRRAANYRFYGFGVQEWIAVRRPDGRIGYLDIEPRPQHTIEQWAVSDNGTIEGVYQRSPQTGETLAIPRAKILYLVEDTLTDSPEGLGVFRHMAEPYERLKQYIELEARAFERDLRGIPIGRVPISEIRRAVEAGELTKDEADKMLASVKEFVEMQVKQSNTGVLLDSQPYESLAQDGRKVSGEKQWDIDLITGSGNGLDELHRAIERLQREMARILGVENVMLGDKVGTRSLAEDKSRNLYLMGDSVLGHIASRFSRDFIDPLWMLNGFPDELKPHFKTESVAPRHVGEITAALREMATAGAVLMPNDPAINDVRELLGISIAPEIDSSMLGLLEDADADKPDTENDEDSDGTN